MAKSYVKIETIRNGSRVDQTELNYEDLRFIAWALKEIRQKEQNFEYFFPIKDRKRLMKLIERLDKLA